MTEEVKEVSTNTEVKAFYQSKIVWIAIATIFLGALDQLNILGGLLPAEYQGVYTMIVGLLTLIARSVTSTSIALTK